MMASKTGISKALRWLSEVTVGQEVTPALVVLWRAAFEDVEDDALFQAALAYAQRRTAGAGQGCREVDRWLAIHARPDDGAGGAHGVSEYLQGLGRTPRKTTRPGTCEAAGTAAYFGAAGGATSGG